MVARFEPRPTALAECVGVLRIDRNRAVEVRVAIDGRGKPPRGSVFVPFFDQAKLVNIVTLDAMDNISKEPDFKKCAVRIERV